MELSEFEELIKKTGFPVGFFSLNEPESLPFVVYGVNGDNDFHADNSRYFRIINVFVELYSESKDTGAEEKVTKAFRDNGIPYGHDYETFIKNEGMYIVRWDIQLLGG